MNRPNENQLEVFVQFLEKNKDVAFGNLNSRHAKQNRKRKWNEVAHILNGVGGVVKDGRGWAKFWADKKCSLKKARTQLLEEMEATGGGTDKEGKFSDFDRKMLDILGPNFGERNPSTYVPPYPDTAIQDEEISNDKYIEVPCEVSIKTRDDSPVSDTSPQQTPIPERCPRPQYRMKHSRLMKDPLAGERKYLSSLEEKRLEAEKITAIALRQTARNLSDCASAIREGSQMIADALRDSALIIANALSNK